MANFYTDNRDLVFTLKNLDLEEAVTMKEENFRFAKEFENAPVDYADACDNYDRVLKVVGEICAERIAPRSRQVDEEGPHFENGVVTYHPLTVQNLKDLTQADVMGVVLPHRYGGLNFPATIYTAITEMVSRADASLQNLVGLQDIAETICEFGSEEQRQAYLPRFAKGEIDGSMDLTEPDSGSDLQSVRLRAYQDKDGNWFLNGMKRFITNGCAKCHLVLARSEEGTTDGRGLSMFIAEACPQLVVRRIEHKLGIHGVATAELQYNDVPAQLCGQRRRGLTRYVMSLMNGARVAISAQALGIAEAAYFEAKKYASEREQFKKSIDNFPAIYDMLSSMKMKILASRALLYETTRAVDLRNAYNALVEKGENVTDEIRAKQPEFREEKKARYQEEYGLPEYDADILTGTKKLADIFEETVALGANPKKVSNWLMVETMRLLKEHEMDAEDITFSAENLAKLIKLVDSQAINSSVAKEVFEIIFEKDIDPDKYVEEKGLKTVNDEGALRATVEKVIADNPQSVEDYRNGKEKAIGFLVGQTMKAMKGKANPGMVNQILKELL